MYKNSLGYTFLLVVMMMPYIVGIWYLIASNNLSPTPQETLNHVKIPTVSLKKLWQPKLDTCYNLNVKEIISLYLFLLLLNSN